MEKREDQDLLELQELALSHKSSKRQKTLEEKQMIVRAHLLNRASISQLSKEFGVSRRAIYKWINTLQTERCLIEEGQALQKSNKIRLICLRRIRNQ